MDRTIDLQNLERKAFRTTYQDGLWDMYIGGVMLCMAILLGAANSDVFPLAQFSVSLAGMAAAYISFWAGKKFVTTPRMGQVRFGSQRRRRMRTLAGVLGGIVVVQVIIVIATIFLSQNPDWSAATGSIETHPNFRRLIVAVGGALFTGLGIALIAHFNDFTRGYYVAITALLGVFLTILYNAPIYMVAAALAVTLPGVVLFVRFVREHPLPPAGGVNG